MSGLDPLAALAADPAALTTAQVQAIDLGVAVEILQQQLSIGDLLTATVLPAQSGVDLLSLFGTTVVAQLPTGVNPGQSLLLQVTGFSDNQILVQNLGIVDPENPPPTVSVLLPNVAEGASYPTAYPAQPPNSGPTAQSSIAPSRAVFVAASVQPSAASRAATPEPASPQTPPAQLTDEPALPTPAEQVAGEVAQLGLEARIAATRAASIDISELVRPSNPTGMPRPPAVPAPGVPARAPLQSAPPLVTARPQPPVPSPVPASARPLVAPSPEAALLERLRIPLTPLTLAAAKVAGNAGTVLPRALARLETLLSGVVLQDGRAASLRTLLGFAGRLDAGNARALPEQLAAFVNNFVGGPEAKLTAMLRAFLQADTAASDDAANASPNAPASAPRPNASPANAPPANAQPAAPAARVALDAPAAALEPAVAARVAERAVALSYDAKATVAAMLEAPARGATPELAAALNDALTAITGLQINVLNAQNLNPNTIAIPIPVFYREQGAPVHMRISRDAPNGGKLDADNFSIAFVLDTNSLGTVAIDVQTAGRTVSVNVKTEGAPAASRFRSTLDDLRDRLEQLRFNVAKMSAAVAPHRTDAETSKPAVEAAPDQRTSSVLDTRA